MKEFELPLSKDYQRPIINTGQIDALIDTGAMIPTFSIPSQYIYLMENAFHANKIKENVSISGFGGECKGSVYEMPHFEVGDLKYKPFQFFVPDKPISKDHPFLLSASMFYGTDYDFNTIDGKFIVKVSDETDLTRSFLLKDLEGVLYAQIGDVLLQEPSIDSIREPDNLFQTFQTAKREFTDLFHDKDNRIFPLNCCNIETIKAEIDRFKIDNECKQIVSNMSTSVREQAAKQKEQIISNDVKR